MIKLMNKIGFSVTFNSVKGIPFYLNLLQEMLLENCKAVEVHAYNLDRFEQHQSIIDLIKKFDFISVHYSGHDINYHIDLASKIGAHALTIHPNFVSEWIKASKSLFCLISFENMDWRKKFGTNVDDMKSVFKQIPDASWTFDLNHIYSIDPTMKLADDFYRSFDNLSHYHLSGFKDNSLPHTQLYETKQDIIIQSVKKDSPIIVESFGVDDIVNFKLELEYVRERIGDITKVPESSETSII